MTATESRWRERERPYEFIISVFRLKHDPDPVRPRPQQHKIPSPALPVQVRACKLDDAQMPNGRDHTLLSRSSLSSSLYAGSVLPGKTWSRGQTLQLCGQLASINFGSSAQPARADAGFLLPRRLGLPIAQFGQSAYLSSQARVQTPQVCGQRRITEPGFWSHSSSPQMRHWRRSVSARARLRQVALTATDRMRRLLVRHIGADTA